jgi:hypothetical protein
MYLNRSLGSSTFIWWCQPIKPIQQTFAMAFKGFFCIYLLQKTTYQHHGQMHHSSRSASLVVVVRARSTQLDLRLCLALPIRRVEVDSAKDNELSSSSSCVSSDISLDESLVLVLVLGGCKWCWRYCMVSKKEFPTCINCKQPCPIGFCCDEKHN